MNAAGGSIDVYSRIIAEHMTATLGRPARSIQTSRAALRARPPAR
jgi:tripartite-type tricarboxylate transporter receptor subunit TctC